MAADFDKTVQHLDSEFSGLQVGRASAGLVENMMVEAYGSSQALKALASISVPDAKSVQIQPWDKGLLSAIEKAIQVSDLNINPVNNGLAIILNIPPLTEERRRDLVKVVGRLAEDARISIRNVRHEALTAVKRMEHEGEITEDEQGRAEKQIQEKLEAVNSAIESKTKQKEESLMTV
mgnify:FL=1